MGGVMNGLSLHGGFRPFGGTFLVFSDYMRPAVRLAALMRVPVVYVFTHDSIGLGEDGPTHQPVEHLAALRAIPGLDVMRPADATETAAAWRCAMTATGPTALALTRQDLASLGLPFDRVREGVERGGYVVSDPVGARPAVVLIGTGSEVGVARAAAERLAAGGIAARVVSMPSPTRFLAQPAAHRAAVLPAGLPRVIVEAATSFGWHAVGGDRAAYVTLEHFGASAPAARLFQEFGLTPEDVERAARSLL